MEEDLKKLEELLQHKHHKGKMNEAYDIIVKYDDNLKSLNLGCLCTQTPRNKVYNAGIKLLEENA